MQRNSNIKVEGIIVDDTCYKEECNHIEIASTKQKNDIMYSKKLYAVIAKSNS